MKKMIMMALALATLGATAGDPRVENVRARQIPDTKDVEVIYDLIAPDGGLFNVSATFQAPGVAPEPRTVTGDFGQNVAPGRNRRFVWDAGVDWPDNVNSNFVCTVSVEEQSDGDHGGVQLWEGGPYWATCNVGASKPEEYGLYFWWGDTVGHAGDWYFDKDHCPTYLKSDAELRSLGYIDSSGNLAFAHDAARAHLGAPWRMPTSNEIDALVNNCDTIWTTRNNVWGRLVKGRGVYASSSIFLPAAGCGNDSELTYLGSDGRYWSSTPYTRDWSSTPYTDDTWILSFRSNHFYRSDGRRRFCDGRCLGLSVRPVRGFAK